MTTITTPPFFRVGGARRRGRSGDVGKRICAGVRKDDRCFGHVKRVVHRFRRDMAEVHEHPDLFISADDLSPEVVQSVTLRNGPSPSRPTAYFFRG